MKLLSVEDFVYYTQQSSQNIENIVSGMTMLINDNEIKIRELENQNWFERMIKTLFGKNKATLGEIKRNKDKINIYIAETILELYNKSLVTDQYLLCLNQKTNDLLSIINKLSSEYETLQRHFKNFVSELDKKIESVENFSIIISKKDLYKSMDSSIAILDLVSKIDERIIFNQEKMDIIIYNMKDWINDENIYFEELFESIISLNEKEANMLYLKMSTYRNNLLVDLILESIERKVYYNQDKNRILNKIFYENEIERKNFITKKELFFKLLKYKKEVLKELKASEIKKEIITKMEIQDKETSNYLLLKAKIEDPKLQYEIGKIFFNMKDFSKSIYWFERSSKQGNRDSLFELSLFYKEGLGIEKNSLKSYQLLKRSALLGNKEAKELIKL